MDRNLRRTKLDLESRRIKKLLEEQKDRRGEYSVENGGPNRFSGLSMELYVLSSFFFLLLFLGVCKGAIIGPVVALLVFVGNSAVIIGLWPAHFFWTYYCLVKTQKLGLVLKMLMLLFLPFPLFLWPVVGILGSLLVGIGYGFFAPLFATFEAVGDEFIDKLYHCFTDGGKDTIKGACTLVRDFTDMCFFSYFSIMDDISEKVNQIAFLCAGCSSWSSY
ncbi:hypothetical protein HPP92_007272 [Vanilla planifolia]|uniref:Transmembrane protein n=1 Tax=Vanilla planifolia TaxID=51239 RepID=A0A835RK03_VANPL|nr:hypothetical protein HPP92_007272 [Vanilla planifolia]